jgi:MFS family permease
MPVGTEFTRGWRVVAGGLLGVGLGLSSLYFYSLGVFIKPIAAEFGWGRGEASLPAFVSATSAALMSIPLGQLVDRVGTLKVAVGSLLLLLLGFVALGTLTTNLVSFLTITAVLSLLASGSSPLPYTRLVVAQFSRKRGLALGIILTGMGLGAVLVPMLLTPYVSRHGWRHGYFVLAGVTTALLPVVWSLLWSTEEPNQTGAVRVPFFTVAKNAAFQRLAAIFVVASMGILGTVVQFIPMLTDWGLSPARAGATAAVIGVSAIVGRVFVGLLLDYWSPVLVTGGLFLLVSAGLLALSLFGVAFATGGATVLGLAVGAESALIAFLVGRYFPKPMYGQIYGALYAAFLFGSAVGPVASGYLQQVSGDYRLSLWAAAGALLVASGLTPWLARVPPIADLRYHVSTG